MLKLIPLLKNNNKEQIILVDDLKKKKKWSQESNLYKLILKKREGGEASKDYKLTFRFMMLAAESYEGKDERLEEILTEFREVHGAPEFLIRVPGRVNLIGDIIV